MKNNIKWLLFFLLICIVCTIIWIARIKTKDGIIAEIRQGNEVIRVIDLSNVKEPYEFKVVDEHGGLNKIRVERGQIAVVQSDCPDKVCVNQGFISNSAVPIVCLPHKLSIVIVSDNNATDAVVGGN